MFLKCYAILPKQKGRMRMRPFVFQRCSLLVVLCSGEALFNLVPVDRVPPGREILGPFVLIFQVVRMLPHVIAQNGIDALAEGSVLIRRCDDGKLAALEDQPAPA